MKRNSLLSAAATLGILLLLCGCRSETVEPSSATPAVSTGHSASHSHAEHGPHNGDLIELGDEEWHAELVHSRQTLTIYILDSTARELVPIDAESVRINLIHRDEPKQYEIPAVPLDTDATGTSSRFELEASGLIHALDHDDAQARLAVIIRGRQYNGAISHDHGDDHSHAAEGEPHAH